VNEGTKTGRLRIDEMDLGMMDGEIVQHSDGDEI